MNTISKKAKSLAISVAERILTPLSTKWLKSVHARSYSEKVFMREGLLPIPDHYYHPLINPRQDLVRPLDQDRNLPGIDFNDQEQLELLNQFHYNDELLTFPLESVKPHEFAYKNGWYESGDAEYLYNMIRYFRPKRIVEIGCGQSTLMIQNAVIKNGMEDPSFSCDHVCVEPFEQPWLEQLGLQIIRKKVEALSTDTFAHLEKHDLLFIDSSHIIRPQGDVLFEFLEILPMLNPGVLVHIHDIFSPKDYPAEWVYKHLLWNEQYLLEAFLCMNPKFRVIGALNYLSLKYPDQFKAKCPVFAKIPTSPKAFWIMRND